MLLNLHVKNLALIEEIDIDFSDNLNILTGETGAGKSIIIGSINIALGARVTKDIIREGKESSLVELLFQVEDQSVINRLNDMEINVDSDGQLIIARKILNNRSISKVNGETITVSKLKQISELLLDIHGQHEHQSLLNKANHLDILDRYAKNEIEEYKAQVNDNYRKYKKISNEINSNNIDEEERKRELSYIEYEINEIENANLKLGEDEELEKAYRKLNNAQQIVSILKEVYGLSGYDEISACGNTIGKCVKHMANIVDLDEELSSLSEQIISIDALLNDFNRELRDYMSDFDYQDGDYIETQQRLDLINSLKAKYGNSIEKVIEYKEKRLEKYNQLLDYEEYIGKLEEECSLAKDELRKSCEQLSIARKKSSNILSNLIKNALIDLNFLDVRFQMDFKRTEGFSSNGYDDAYFVISTNPGEKLRPIWEVASGGELSRIMLAIKSVLADVDSIETLIFDEIDVGISGRTAQKVSEKMAVIARKHQVISITHLPQIAAMADAHYIIEKTANSNKTTTSICLLDYNKSITELARLISGVEITKTALDSAKEMKDMANKTKIY